MLGQFRASNQMYESVLRMYADGVFSGMGKGTKRKL